MTVTVLVAGAWTPGYDHRTDTVSRLASADQPYANAARAAIVLNGLLIVVVARAVGATVAAHRRGFVRLVTLCGAATVVAGIAPKDPPHVPTSMLSQIHVAAAASGGVALVAAMALVAVSGRQFADRRASVLAGALTAGAGAAFPFLWGTMIYGLLERLLLVVAATWLITIAADVSLAGPNGVGGLGNSPGALPPRRVEASRAESSRAGRCDPGCHEPLRAGTGERAHPA
jgi:hypothetical protein